MVRARARPARRHPAAGLPLTSQVPPFDPACLAVRGRAGVHKAAWHSRPAGPGQAACPSSTAPPCPPPCPPQVRGELTGDVRKKVNTLVITDVHARDIVDTFVRDSIMDAREFAWESQLRFYWDKGRVSARWGEDGRGGRRPTWQRPSPARLRNASRQRSKPPGLASAPRWPRPGKGGQAAFTLLPCPPLTPPGRPDHPAVHRHVRLRLRVHGPQRQAGHHGADRPLLHDPHHRPHVPPGGGTRRPRRHR
jgi:hypothetical protein